MLHHMYDCFITYFIMYRTQTSPAHVSGCSQAEYRAINKVFPHANLRMNSTKSMIGHLLGGAGAVEAVATVQAIRTGKLHPSINITDPEDGVDLTRVCANTAIEHDVDVALSNSFGFGGHNSCIMFRKFKH